MARNDVTNGSNLRPKINSEKSNRAVSANVCANCGGSMEMVANRLFLMYKRARLPQPKAEASVCSHCGWVDGDEHFQALLEERINHR